MWLKTHRMEIYITDSIKELGTFNLLENKDGLRCMDEGYCAEREAERVLFSLSLTS